jgi:inhibitor of cysteine peptidase
MYTADIGTCKSCGGHTSSGGFKLCVKCSDQQQKCQHCLTSLGEAKTAEKTDEKPGKEPAAKLTDADKGKTIKVKQGDVITVSLKGNPTTGYSWRSAKTPGEALEAVGKPQYTVNPHPPGMVGVGGVFVFTFKAAKPGKAEIQLEYVRPWEKDKKPVQTFSAMIEVE